MVPDEPVYPGNVASFGALLDAKRLFILQILLLYQLKHDFRLIRKQLDAVTFN